MALPGIPIPGTQCIGDSLFSINNALTALDSSVIELINAGGGGGGRSDVTGTSPITVTGTDVKNVSVNVQLLTAALDDYFVPSSGGGGSFNAPVGYVGYYAATSAPTGWAECNGAAVTVALGSTYTDIRNFLIAQGSPFGVSGSDPRLPDLRGRFIRSFGTDTTVSPVVSSAAFGVKQADEFKSHAHTVQQSATFSVANGSSSGVPTTPFNSSTGATGGTETRPANLALLACIKL